jgi:hypothetical protein
MDRILNYATMVNWGITDPARFNSLIEELKTIIAPGFFIGDNLITWGRNNSLLEDEHFLNSLNTNAFNASDLAIAWRRYILATSAYHCTQLEGDFVECGVYAGTGIKTVMDYLGGKEFPKNFWGYDTFDYNPVEGHSFPGQTDGFFDQVSRRFEGYEQVKLIKGFIPQSFEQGIPDKIAYLHIDLNNAEGEIAALEVLFPRVVAGGYIILDDYEWAGMYRDQKRTEDPWFEKQGYRITPLPTGQGFLVKR